MGLYALFFASFAADLSFAAADLPATLLFFLDILKSLPFTVVVVDVPHYFFVLLVPGYTLSSRFADPGILRGDFGNPGRG